MGQVRLMIFVAAAVIGWSAFRSGTISGWWLLAPVAAFLGPSRGGLREPVRLGPPFILRQRDLRHNDWVLARLRLPKTRNSAPLDTLDRQPSSCSRGRSDTRNLSKHIA